jgi:photoactive yellow protein
VGIASNTSHPNADCGMADPLPVPATFDDPGLFGWLERAAAEDLDALPFGVVAMATDATVEHYNATEGKLAGLTPDRIVGRHFFEAVAPCMNNFMVAERFATEPEINDTINYILTFRMAPKKVKLRLLKRLGGRRIYLIVERRI